MLPHAYVKVTGMGHLEDLFTDIVHCTHKIGFSSATTFRDSFVSFRPHPESLKSIQQVK